MAVVIGTAPLIIPATEESIHCWAIGKSVSGMAIQMIPRAATRARSAGSMGRRARGTSASASIPSAIRASVITPGSNASRPMAMNRNEDPQMSAMPVRRPQSNPPKAS